MERFQYLAFISYSRKNEFWAKWLHKKLENYKIPSLVKRQFAGRIPDKLRPVFLDVTDIGVGKLEDTLKKELDDSRYLIVICSPDAAKSQWVNSEIAYFQSIGRGDRIIPFIVEGTPDPANPGEASCYPESLDKQLLGVSLAELDKEKAFIKITAAILGLKFDMLWQRHRKQEKKNRFNRNLWIYGSLLVVLAASLFIWNHYYRTTYKYFSDYVDRFGLPVGIDEIRSGELNKKFDYYAFSYRADKLRSVSHEQHFSLFSGNKFSANERPSLQKFYYNNKNGNLEVVEVLDNYGNVLVSQKYAGEELEEVDLKDPLGKTKVLPYSISQLDSKLSVDENETSSNSSINHYSLTRNSQGEITKVLFKNGTSLASDVNGIYGKEFRLDSIGRVIQTSFLGKDGQYTADNTGVWKEVNTYFGKANTGAVENRDSADRPMTNYLGWAKRITEINESEGKLIQQFFDETGKPTENKQGISQAVAILNDYSKITEIQYFDLSGKLSENDEGVAKITINYDQNGYLNEMTFFNSQNRRCNSTDGYSQLKVINDKSGNFLEMAFFDTLSRPFTMRSGASSIRLKRDSYGNIIQIDAYESNVSGKIEPLLQKRRKYDKKGNLVEESCFDGNNLPCLNGDGYSIIRYEYDDRNNMRQAQMFDQNMKPCSDYLNVHLKKFDYDDQGNQIKLSFFDTEGKACLNSDNMSTILIQYDDRGNQQEVTVLNTRGLVDYDKKGIAIYSYKYDSRGNQVKTVFLDANRQPITNINGVSMIESDFDKKNRLTERRFYDPAYEPTLNDSGVFKIQYEYRRFAKPVNEKYFNTRKERTRNRSGFSRINYEYNTLQYPVHISYLDEHDKPCINTSKNISTYRYAYNDAGGVIKESYYNQLNRPCNSDNEIASIEYKYDSRNNRIEEQYFDVTGRPAIGPQNISKIIRVYSPRNLVTEERSFDTTNHPCLSSEGYHCIKNIYDSHDNLSEQRFFDIGDKACLTYINASIVRFQYNDKNLEAERTYFDVAGAPCINKYGYAKIVMQYNERGDCISEEFFDVGGSLIEKSNGVAQYKSVFDKFGRIKIDSLFDKNRQLIEVRRL